jgi:anti-sigma B factor antagonist
VTTSLTCTVDRHPDGAAVVVVAGEIDMSNTADFAAALDGAGDGPLVVDLTSVDYIDSAGLAALFPHVERLRLRATALLEPVLRVAGLDDITELVGPPPLGPID